MSSELGDFAPRSQWKALGSIAVIESVREDLRTGKVSTERRYYLSSLGVLSSEQATAERIASITRSHWSVENVLHWRLDVQWGEDARRARSGKATTNLSGLRKLAMNLLRAVPPPLRKPTSVSMRRRHYVATINPNHFAALLVHFVT